jgi:predicted transcriptional regulator
MPTKNKTFMIDPETDAKLREMARQDDRSESSFLRQLISGEYARRQALPAYVPSTINPTNPIDFTPTA